VNLDIPDDLRTRMEARAAQTGHQTLEQYVEALIRDDAATDADHGAPEPLKVAPGQQLQALVLEGPQSPTHQDRE
jgi:hypothetical protein